MSDQPRPHHEQVGLICAGWARLELAIDTEIWLLMGVHLNVHLGACVTNELISVHAKLRALISLCRMHKFDNSIIKNLNTYNANLYGTSERRNRAVHDAWVIDSNNKLAGQWDLGKTKAETGRHVRVVPISELTALTEDIQQQYARFLKIRIELNNASRAWRESLTQSRAATHRDQNAQDQNTT